MKTGGLCSMEERNVSEVDISRGRILEEEKEWRGVRCGKKVD